MIVVGLVAGRGIGDMALRVMEPIYSDPLVDQLYVCIGEPPDMPTELKQHPKITPVYHTIRAHGDLGPARNTLLNLIEAQCDPDWLMIGDEDGLIDPGFFLGLDLIPINGLPILATGRMRNADGNRWYDICGFIKCPNTGAPQPVALPYNEWMHKKWNKSRYANGGQHILNRSARALKVRYQHIDGEDPHFCWDFVKAGGRIQFVPDLGMTLAKQHGPCYVLSSEEAKIRTPL